MSIISEVLELASIRVLATSVAKSDVISPIVGLLKFPIVVAQKSSTRAVYDAFAQVRSLTKRDPIRPPRYIERPVNSLLPEDLSRGRQANGNFPHNARVAVGLVGSEHYREDRRSRGQRDSADRSIRQELRQRGRANDCESFDVKRSNRERLSFKEKADCILCVEYNLLGSNLSARVSDKWKFHRLECSRTGQAKDGHRQIPRYIEFCAGVARYAM